MAFVPFVESDQPTMANFNEKFQQAIAAGTQFAHGSYTGSGTYGASNPTKLTFPFKPYAVIVAVATQVVDTTASGATVKSYSVAGGFPWIRGMDVGLVSRGFNTSGFNSVSSCNLTWGDDFISFYSSSASSQFNYSGATYYYMAIGGETT